MGVAALGLDLDASATTYAQNRARVQLWYSAGEPVWMAVDGMKQLIKGAIVDRRSYGEVAAMRAAVKAGCM
jgi:dihydroxyacid dehydratase/phosphogluconate dehydratase